MPPIPPLFTLPIAATKGAIVATQPAPRVYLLTFTSPPDNRLTPDFNSALLLALDIIEHRLPRGVVVTTSGIAKFYSNGLDFEAAIGIPGFFEKSFHPVVRRLLSYPMPTIALMNGHTFAGGLMYAMAHDYRVFNPAKGYLCLNEVEFGAPLRPRMAGIFKAKLPPAAWRSLALEARRYNGEAALADGIVDVLGSYPEAEKLIVERKLADKGKAGVYGVIKQEFYRDIVQTIDAGDDGEDKLFSALQDNSEKLSEEGQNRVDEWEKSGGKIAGAQTEGAKL